VNKELLPKVFTPVWRNKFLTQRAADHTTVPHVEAQDVMYDAKGAEIRISIASKLTGLNMINLAAF
jgi:hypothetical protein